VRQNSIFIADGEQGWRTGESVRLPPMWFAGSIPARCHMWVEFVVGSRLALRVLIFCGFSGFPPSTKTNKSKFLFDHDGGPA